MTHNNKLWNDLISQSQQFANPYRHEIWEDFDFDFQKHMTRFPEDVYYTRISPEESWNEIPFDISVIDCQTNGKHPLWLLIPTAPYVYVPLTISEHPILLGSGKEIPFSKKEIERLWVFVMEYRKELAACDKSDVDEYEIFEKIFPISLDIAQGHEFVWDAEWLRKEETGLPMNIWVGGGCPYVSWRFGARIKFQNDTHAEFDSHNLIPMLVADKPIIPKKRDRKAAEAGIGKEAIAELARFVSDYSPQLKMVLSRQASLRDVFLPYVRETIANR